ncbi:response regulator transcription factor [Reichenbachiella agariperforans]|uniref:DNA-binding response regulator, NarL/FixJ family, contains REC and HTH domains n=1 Tax=Reichenbachiella agariperforans TaxID=156994 RepID=A0A1M6SSL8_REIAG|nr:response regulator transcription factor [Reichenbachiella agariperforans]MBU2916259.1 response regulator transcription factor [Reichenbachiella agariperforans]SHK47724.1 DNA-binding response regulator, NarL/FixJ family, contains REC and HTH domains [Reichenbachiella agariperforans]
MPITQSVIIADSNYLSMQGLQNIVTNNSALELIESISDIADRAQFQYDQADIYIINTSRNTKVLTELAMNVSSSKRVLAIANTSEVAGIKKLWKHGIQSIVTDHCSEQEISQAIEHLANKENFYCNTILDLIKRKSKTSPRFGLTKREYEILLLITKGKSSKDISEQLFLSPHTVNSHRKNILKKLNLKSPAELIIFALDNNI